MCGVEIQACTRRSAFSVYSYSVCSYGVSLVLVCMSKLCTRFYATMKFELNSILVPYWRECNCVGMA